MARTNIWLSGQCSIFAAALQRKFGGEIYAIVNHSNKFPDDDYLIHAYCIINGIAYDATGPNDLAKVSCTANEEIPEMDKNNEVQILWQKVDLDWFDKYHEDFCKERLTQDCKLAYSYIRRHPKLFQNLTPL